MKIKEIMERLGQGEVAEEFDNKLTQAALATVKHGGKATVSLTLTINPNGADGVTLTPVVKLATPLVKHSQTFLFVGEDGLTANDPKQLTFEKEIVDAV